MRARPSILRSLAGAALLAVLVLLAASAEAREPPCEPVPGAEALVASREGCPGLRGTEAIIFGSAVPQVPPPSEVDRVLDTQRGHDKRLSLAADVDLDETSVLNAIALSRASDGAASFDTGDVSTRATTGEGGMTWFNFLIPKAGNVLNALTLGVGPVNTTGFDVSYAGFNSASSNLEEASRLANDTTLSGLILLGGGVPLDPRELLETRAEGESAAAVNTFPPPSIPPKGLDLAAQAAIAPIRGDAVPSVYGFSQRDIRHGESSGDTRDVALPEDVAFAAVALHRNGVPVEGADALSVAETDRFAVAEEHDRSVEPDVLRYWLTLGLRFE